MVKFMERKNIWFGLSLLLLLPGIVSLLVWHLQLGRDFKGGSLDEYVQARVGETSQEIQQKQASDAVKQAFDDNHVKDYQIQSDTHEDTVRVFVKSPSINQDDHNNIVRRLKDAKPTIEEVSFESIDPQVGAEVTRRAISAIIIASFVIIIYIALSFRGVAKPVSSWQFGVIAVVALFHDVLFIIGFYSLMGHFFGWEVNSEFVTAALTVMGFSVHDTIVVFDRVRENLKRMPGKPFSMIANVSLAQTIARSLNTSLTVVLVLLAIVLLGGDTIRPFSLTLLIGIIVGTYSSIFVATPLLDWWQIVSPKLKKSKRFGFSFKRQPKTT